MIYELRVYSVATGRMPDVLSRFEKYTLPIWKRIGIRPKGFFTSVIGPDSNRLTYLLEWADLAERERKWDAFASDPEWSAAKGASEAHGPTIESMSNSILAPTVFSPAL